MTTTQSVEMKLIHTMAHALRHDPTKYGLEPDPEGWVSFDDLVTAIRYERRDSLNIERDDIVELLAAMESDRFEIAGAKIRAVYGHSIVLEKPPPIQIPPDVLFHGTSAENVDEIMTKGLLRMNRQFVHLSSDLDWVLRFVADKERWVVFRVLANVARDNGVAFRQANRHVWLADSIDQRFLQIEVSRTCQPSGQICSTDEVQ